MAEAKVATDVIKIISRIFICRVGADLFSICVDSDSRNDFTPFGSLTFSSFLGMPILLRHCGILTPAQGEVCKKILIWVEKSETHGKKYNIVANAFFSWVSFLKKILSKF